MDKKLLDALSNLSQSLQEISEVLSKKSDESKNSETTNVLIKGNFVQNIKSIDEGVKSLQKDNKKIIKNQETLLELSKKAPGKKSPLDKITSVENTEKLKDGLSSITMIAVGLLAIGTAFKLIGGVNFASVIALSLALPLMAISFEKIANMKSLNATSAKNLLFVVLAISSSIALSSYILSGVKSISTGQITTSLMIVGMFTMISYSMAKLTNGLSSLKTQDLFKLPLILVTISSSIALSSYILQFVKPVGLYQLTTAIFIAGAFAAISLGLSGLVRGLRSAGSMKDIAMTAVSLPLILVGISTAIALSSIPLSMIRPIGLFQFITAVMISLTFIPIAYSLPLISKAIKDIDTKKILMLPIVMVAMATAIMASSHILSLTKTIDIGKLFNIVAQALALSLISVAFGLSLKMLGNITPSTLIKGGLAIILIAGTIMLSSQILSLGKYDKFPSIGWTLGTGLSLVAFGLSAVVLGLIATSGIGAVAIVAGCAAVLLIATTVVATSHILSKGNYEKYPTTSWSAGVGLSMIPFGLASLTLGTIALTGIGAVAMATGLGIILLIAATVTKTAEILNNGVYGKYPDITWSEGVANSLSSFGSILGNIGLKGILLNAIGSVLGNGPIDIAKQIVSVDQLIRTGQYNKYPGREWSSNVATMLVKFASITKSEGLSGIALNAIGKIFGSGPEDIAKQILAVDNVLSKGKFDKFPSTQWVNGVMGFSTLLPFFEKSSNLNISEMGDDLINIASSYDKLSTSLQKLGSTINQMDITKLSAVKNLTGSIVMMSLMDPDQFERMMDTLEDKAKIFIDVINGMDGGSSEQITRGSRAGGVTTQVKSPNKGSKAERTINDLYQVLSSVDNKLSQIASSNNNLSKYVDEIRTVDLNLKK